MRAPRTTVTVVLLLGALAGCSSNAPVPSPAASTGPADYTDAGAVLAALTAAGQPCGNPTPGEPGTTVGAVSVENCSSPADTGQPDTVVIVFDTHGDAQAYATQMLAAPDLLPGTQLVVGTTWAIDTQAPYGTAVAGLLGGNVQTPTPAPSS